MGNWIFICPKPYAILCALTLLASSKDHKFLLTHTMGRFEYSEIIIAVEKSNTTCFIWYTIGKLEIFSVFTRLNSPKSGRF